MATMPEMSVTISVERTGVGARLVERLRGLVMKLDGVREGARWWHAMRAALGMDPVDLLIGEEPPAVIDDAASAAALVDQACTPVEPFAGEGDAPAVVPREHEAHRAERLNGLSYCQREVFDRLRRGEPMPRGTRPATLDALVRADLLRIVQVNRFAIRHRLVVDDAADRAWAWNLRYGVGCEVRAAFRVSAGMAKTVPTRLASQAHFVGGVAVADVVLGPHLGAEYDGEVRTLPIDHIGPGGAFRVLEADR